MRIFDPQTFRMYSCLHECENSNEVEVFFCLQCEPAASRTLAQRRLAATQSFKYQFVCQGSPF